MHTHTFLRLAAVLVFSLTFVATIRTGTTHARSTLNTEPHQCARGDSQCTHVFLPLVMHSPQSRVGPFDLVGSYIPDDQGYYGPALSTVVISGSTGFMAGNRLHVVDVHDPTKPTLISSSAVAHSYDNSTVGGTTWVGTANSFEHGGAPISEANIVDVRNLRKPVLRHSLGLWAGWYNGLDMVRNTLYLVQGRGYPHPGPTQGGLEVYDLRDPSKPVLRGKYDFLAERGVSVEVQNRMAYVGTKVAGGRAGLAILDVSNPVSITLRSSLVFTVTEQSDLSISGGIAYVGTYTTGFATVDVSRPDKPRLLGHYATQGSVQRLAVDRDLLYVLTETHRPYVLYRELQVFDVRNPASPQFMGSYRQSGKAGGLLDFAVKDNLVYLATRNGLQILRYHPDEATSDIVR